MFNISKHSRFSAVSALFTVRKFFNSAYISLRIACRTSICVARLAGLHPEKMVTNRQMAMLINVSVHGIYENSKLLGGDSSKIFSTTSGSEKLTVRLIP